MGHHSSLIKIWNPREIIFLTKSSGQNQWTGLWSAAKEAVEGSARVRTVRRVSLCHRNCLDDTKVTWCLSYPSRGTLFLGRHVSWWLERLHCWDLSARGYLIVARLDCWDVSVQLAREKLYVYNVFMHQRVGLASRLATVRDSFLGPTWLVGYLPPA